MATLPALASVLLIDPSKEDRDYWVHRLRLSLPDCVVLEAETGQAGLAICRAQRVDCVVTELSLPDMSGFELLAKLVPRARYPERAVVVLTRLVLDSMITLALNNGARAYLTKSRSSGDDLDRAIRKAMAAIGPNKDRQRHVKAV